MILARRLRAVRYGLGRALGGAARRPLVSLLATGAIGVSLLLVGVVGLAAENVARLTGSWGRGVQMVVYLDDRASAERGQAIAEILRAARGVERVEYITPEAAYERLRNTLGRPELLDGVEVGYLPASLEVTLAGGVRSVAAASPLVDRLRRTPGVEEVEFLGDWVDRLVSLLGALRWIALALGLLVSGACVYVIAGTIQLGLHARRDELDVLRLVGATDLFVKAPLVIEGALEGALGAAAALGGLYLLYRLGAPRIEGMLGGAALDVRLAFLRPAQVLLAVAGGAALGVVGSWLAVGRHGRA